MLPSLTFFAVVGYLGAAVAARRGRRLVGVPAGIALLLHAVLLNLQLFRHGALTIGVSESVSLVAWLSALLLWTACWRQPLHMLGVGLYPLAALAVLLATLLPSPAQALPARDWRLETHVVLSVLSAGVLTLAALQAVALAAQDRLLHHRRAASLGWAARLPPLQTMERLLFGSITLGWWLLSFTLLTGFVFVQDLFAQHLVHKTTLSILAWIVFGILLAGRLRFGWRGRRAMRWTLSGYLLLILAYFGSKIVLELILDTHWG